MVKSSPDPAYVAHVEEWQQLRKSTDAAEDGPCPTPEKKGRCSLFPFMSASTDAESVPEDYWNSHKPFIIRRRSTLNAQQGDNEDGVGKYADEEYDQVRKVRIELENGKGVFGAMSNFFAGSSKASAAASVPVPVPAVVSEPAVVTAKEGRIPSTATLNTISVVDTPAAVPDAAPIASLAPLPSASLFSFLDPTIEAITTPFSSSPRTPATTNVVPAPVVSTVSAPVTFPVDLSITRSTSSASTGPAAPASAPATLIGVPATTSLPAGTSFPQSFTIPIPAIDQSFAKTLPSDPNSMTSEELDVIRYNASILARKQRVEEFKQLIEMADNDSEKTKLKSELKSFLQTPPPTLAPR